MHSSGPDDRSKEPLATIRGFRTGGRWRADRRSGTREESWCLQNNLGEGSKGLARAVRWERKESLGRSLADVHLPDMCKIRVPPSAPENRKKSKTGGDKETVPARGGMGPAWGVATPSGLPQCLCLCNAWMLLSSASPVCLGLGFVSPVSSLWQCFFLCRSLEQQGMVM